MSNFMSKVQFVANMVEPPADDSQRLQLADLWLTPATIADYSDSDFVYLPPQQRTQLRQAVENFRKVAEVVEASSTVTPEYVAEALAAFETIRIVLKPFTDPESEKVRLAIWRAWQAESVRDWIPTFDYELRDNSTGDPSAWVWFILNDDVEIEADQTYKSLNRLQWRTRQELQKDGIERWPYTSVRLRSEVKELMARAPA
jgi:hypothetical protein